MDMLQPCFAFCGSWWTVEPQNEYAYYLWNYRAV